MSSFSSLPLKSILSLFLFSLYYTAVSTTPLTTNCTIPTPQCLNSSLQILTHNDLYGNFSQRFSSVLVLHTPLTESSASSACSLLHENTWPGDTTSTFDLTFLRFLNYGKDVKDDARSYRISSKPSGKCKAMTAKGKIREVDCQKALPVLCSNFAGLGRENWSDTAERWRVGVVSQEQTFVGYRDKLSFRFLGLRYAPQPARFAHAKYVPPSSATTISALNYSKQCLQSGCTNSTCSEDCHFLNIWTPYLPLNPTSSSKQKHQLKPVMVWIHGGGFTSGAGSDPTFDGGNMASRGDVVVVTINYRLGSLGFLALNDNSTITGNYGIVDQLTALEWLHNHVSDFGGDPENITIFGQSAGAASVRALLAIMAERRDIPKVAGAIMMSNPNGLVYASTYSEYMSLAEAEVRNKPILSETGCYNPDKKAELTCLRAVEPFKLVSGKTVARYPVIDGIYLKSDLPLRPGDKKLLEIPILQGIMRDDGAPFSKLIPTTNVSQALTQLEFDSAQIVSSNKFPTPHGNNATLNVFNVTARVTTDAEFRCLGQSTVAAAVKNGVFSKVYGYEIHRAYQIVEWSPNPPTCLPPVTPNHPLGDTSQEYFRCHSGELYYVFGTLIRQGQPPRDELDIPFSQYLVDTWTAFAREKNPHPDRDFLEARGFTNTSRIIGKLMEWRPSSSGKPVVRLLDTNVKDVEYTEVEQCNALGLPLNYYFK
ncbi:alpha/beta-hydrolase [Delitschia confertaspora ATCC 74209]|uniref:Alpha/beta-hydrolase n=1 Tax=Delitschia confertaspora ATCC 74209 TaxID=1513339 RepID=A0A9P4JM11_9PLEO|nr:alpha/beta-hydrolase [Delitschia confertaspora ATCC 74209]